MSRWTLPVAVPLILLAACSSSHPVATANPHPVPPSVSPTAAPADPAIAACFARKAVAGDIIVRTIFGTGQQAQAQLLGDQWGWNYTSGECQTGADVVIAGAPTGPGACVKVALAKDNPGYNADAVPAAQLRKVIAASPGC